MAKFDFDLFVIGAGSGGVRAARVAAAHGAKVAIAEEDRFGGTCVIRGCVPKKLLVYASRFADEFEDAEGFGWSVAPPEFSWRKLIAAKDKEIARLEGLYKNNLAKSGVAIFTQRATVAGLNTVQLAGGGGKVSAARILIATGGMPNLDQKLPGIEHVITSNEAFDLEKLPARIVVAGGGYIAVEFASIFAGLGSEVTLLYRGEKILRGFDMDLREGLIEAMQARGIKMVMGTVFKSIEKKPDGLHGNLSDNHTVIADAIMFAIGRTPNTRGLGLEETGVILKASGAVTVDGQQRTSVPSIFAIGDVTDRVNLTPVAIREGHHFADREFGAKNAPVHYSAIPTAVFTTPEIGTVGFSEDQARATHGAVDIYKSRFRPMKSVLGDRPERMLIKLVVDCKTNKMLGVHILGPDAAEIVQMAAIALRMGATKADFDQTMALHPSIAEELVTMREKWQAPV